MKLHLPLALRSSLLSCLAAATCSLTMTTGVLTTGTVAIVLANASQAEAATASGIWPDTWNWEPEGITYTAIVSGVASRGNINPLAENTDATIINYTATAPSAVNNIGASVNFSGRDIVMTQGTWLDDGAAIENSNTAALANGALSFTPIDNPFILNINSNIIANSTWLANGCFRILAADAAGRRLNQAGTIYAVGGQLWFTAYTTGGMNTVTSDFVLGTSTFAEGTDASAAYDNAALRVERNLTLSGTVTLVDDAPIYVQGSTLIIEGSTLTLNGHQLLKSGTGILQVNTRSDMSFSGIVMQGGTLHTADTLNTDGSNNRAIELNGLDVQGTSTLSHTGWNSIWNIGALTSSVNDSSAITLTLDLTGSHFYRQLFKFEDSSAVASEKLFTGTINVQNTGWNTMPERDGYWKNALYAGSSNQLAEATINLGSYAILGITGNSVSIAGLTSTDTNAWVFSGEDTATAVLTTDTNTYAPRYETDGQERTLILTGSGVYTYKGSLGNNLIIRKTGSGSQTLGHLGDNVTVHLTSGSLALLGTLGQGSTITTETGTALTIPWLMTSNGDISTATYNFSGTPSYIRGGGTVKTNHTICATGSVVANPTDAAYTILNGDGFTGDSVTVVSGLVNIAGSTNIDTISTFVLERGGLIFTSENDTCNKNLVIESAGYLRTTAASGNATVSGSISGSGVLVKTDAGALTITGDMHDFTGGVNIASGTLTFDTDASLAFTGGVNITSGTLTFDTDASLTSLTMSDGTTLGVSGGHKVILSSTYASPWKPGVGVHTFQLEDGGDFFTTAVLFSGTANAAQITTFNLTTNSHGSFTTTGLIAADQRNTVINIGTGTALNLTGSRSTSVHETFLTGNTFVVNHWNSTTAINVSGTFNMLEHGEIACINPNRGNPRIDILEGGILNFKGLSLRWRDTTRTNVIIALNDGGAMHLGSGGISNAEAYLTLELNGGTIGILSSTTAWSSEKALALTGDVTFDTRHYIAATDGQQGTYSETGGTITLAGAITGDGRLIKKGVGTLNLANVNKLEVQQGFVGMNGTLNVTDLATMTENGGRFLIDLGTDAVTASSYAGLVNITANATAAGTYDIFQGSTSLSADQINFDIFLDRGLTFEKADLSVNNGMVSVTIGGEALTEYFDLTWAGESGETWSNSTVQAWTGADDQRFSTGDRVTFNGAGLPSVTIEGIVSPGAITVTGDTDYTFAGGALAGTGSLEKSGNGSLSILSDTSSWEGAITLTGGTLAFSGALGSGSITVSNTTTLAWHNGNTTDLSGRLNLSGEGVHLTFDTGANSVIFGTAVSGTATYVKRGSGTLTLNVLQTLSGDMTVAEGVLSLARADGNAGTSSFIGSITVEQGAELYLATEAALGWGGSRVTSLLLNEGSTMRIGAGTYKSTITRAGLTMRGAQILADDAIVSLELNSNAVITIEGSRLSSIASNLLLDDNNTTNGTTTFNVADVTTGVDLLVTGNVTGNRGTRSLLKSGVGTMEITGKYTAGSIDVAAGELILHGGEVSGINMTVTNGAQLTFASGSTFLWDTSSADRTLSGRMTIEGGGVLQTSSNGIYQTTLDAAATLTGEGTWITGIATEASQNEAFRTLTINGNTADFTGVLEMHGTAADESGKAFRTQLVLNSADNAMNGIVRLRGVLFGGWGTISDLVVPLQNEVVLQKSMAVGGFEGTGGTLRTDVGAGNRVTLTVGRDDDHTFSGSVGAQIDLVKTGSGTQAFNGDLSSFDGSVTIQSGKLDLGTANLANNLTITGANASLTAGKVTIGTGHTLQVTATGVVIHGALELAGGTLDLSTLPTGTAAIGLGNNALSLSSANKTVLSLTLPDDLAAGSTIDLFTGVSALQENGVALTSTGEIRLDTYFNTTDITGLTDATLALNNGTLQIVLARATNSLLYDQDTNPTWKTDGPFAAESTPFVASSNVEFGEIAGERTEMTVQLSGNLEAGNILIHAGEGKTWHFTQESVTSESNRLIAFNGMRIDSGTADFAANTLHATSPAMITVDNNATLLLQNGADNENVSILLSGSSTLQWGSGNTTDYSGRLTIADNADVTLNTNGNEVVLNGSVSGSNGCVTLAGGGLTLGGGNVLHGSLNVNNQTLTLNDSEAAYDLNIERGGGTLIALGNVKLTGTNLFAGAMQIGNSTISGSLSVTTTSLGSNVTGIALAASPSEEEISSFSTFNYEAETDATIAAAITGTGNVFFTGDHKITLTGTNTYTGTTTIAANTTLEVTDATLSTGTQLAGSGLLYLTNTQTSDPLNFGTQVSEGVSVTVEGGTINWLTDTDHAKTYTGTTTIAAGTTVTASGPLTTGENSKIVLAGATSTLRLTLTAEPTSWTTGHTISGAGVLELQAEGVTFTAGGTLFSGLIDTTTDAATLGTLRLLSGSALQITSSTGAQVNVMAKINAIDVTDGAHFSLCALSSGTTTQTMTIAGNGLAGAASGEGTAAALRLGDGNANSYTLNRQLTLAANATIYVNPEKEGLLAETLTLSGHTLTKTGAGTLVFEKLAAEESRSFHVQAGTLQYRGSASNTFSDVILEGGSTLSFYKSANNDNGQTITTLTLDGSATLQTTNHSGMWTVENLVGEDKTLMLDGNSTANQRQYFIIQGGSSFSGTIDVRQSATGTRHVVLMTEGDTLANAHVNLSSRNNSSSSLSFAVGGSTNGTVSIGGLSGIAAAALVSTNAIERASSAIGADGNHRTLQIMGEGTYDYEGSVGANLTVVMAGEGTQKLSGALANGTTFEAKAGTLQIASTLQTGTHQFMASGGILDMDGYTRTTDTNATGTDTLIYSNPSSTIKNLTLTSGMELKADDNFTGSIQLGGATVLSGGSMSFRLTNENDDLYEDLTTSYTLTDGSTLSVAEGTKTMLTFIPIDKRLDPSDESEGKDYTLISNVGEAFTGMELTEVFEMNMSTQGRTKYTLKITDNNLVLNVQGRSAELTWKGSNSNIWNTTDLAWTNGTNTETLFMDDDYVLFDTMDSNQTITVDTDGVRMGGMTVVGETNYTFNGGSISSSEGLSTATLTVGTVDNDFKGTLTLNTANTYAGNSTINSGTVVAGNAGALSNTALVLNGGTLSLNFEGDLGVSGVTMNGGEIDALQNASVSTLTLAGTDKGKTFAAKASTALELTFAANNLEGALTIGSQEKTGTVQFNIGAASLTTGQNITVNGGELKLDGSGSFTGTSIALQGGGLSLTGGLTATLASLSGTGGGATINGSTLVFSGTADVTTAIDATNATISSGSGTLTLGNLHLATGTTALTGSVTLNEVRQDADTVLSVGKATTAGEVGTTGQLTLGMNVTSLGTVEVTNGSTMTLKDGDSMTFLTSWGTLTTDAASANISIGDAWLKNGASIDDKITLTLTGGSNASWLGDDDSGEKTTMANVIVDGASAVVNLAGNVEITSVLVKKGTVASYYNSNTVTNGLTLDGEAAIFNLNDKNPNIAVTMKQGSLQKAGSYTGTITVSPDAPANSIFKMGGLTDKATVVLGQFAQSSQLTELGSLKLGDSTLRLSSNMRPLFVMNATTGTVGIADDVTVTIVCSSIRNEVLRNGTGTYTLTNGSLSGLLGDDEKFKTGVVFDPTLSLYNIVASINGGDLVLTVLDSTDDRNVYTSTRDGADITTYDAVDGYVMVNIDVDTTIDLTGVTPTAEEGLVLKNLHNENGANLTIKGDSDKTDIVTLNNNLNSTLYEGNIHGYGVKLEISNTDAVGDGFNPSDEGLRILGSFVSEGAVAITNGKLTLDGNDNELGGGLSFSSAENEKGLLTINGTTSLAGDIIGGRGDSPDINSPDILVGKGTTVTLKDSALFNACISGNNAETLSIDANAQATIGENARTQGLGLYLGESSSTLLQSGDALAFNGLSGTGTLSGDRQVNLELAANTTAIYEGDLSSKWNGEIIVSGEGSQVLTGSTASGTLTVSNGNLTLRNSSGGSGADMTVGATKLLGGTLHFDTRATNSEGDYVNRHISLTSLETGAPVMRSSTANTLIFDMNLTNELASGTPSLVTVTGNQADIAKGTEIVANVHDIAADFTFNPGDDMSFTLIDGLSLNQGTATNADTDLTFSADQSVLNKYFSNLFLTIEDNKLLLTGTVVTADQMHYHSNAATTETGRSGGTLLDYLFVTANPQGTASGSLAANVLDSMEDLIGNNRSNADRVMASIAGSTVTTLSASFASDLDNRMRAIRDRMTGMGVDQTLVNEDMPYFHAWISANAGNTTLDADSTLAGYKLTSTGGTVGVDVDVTEHLTLGASFTASYGDLTADGAEYAKGHLDTYTAAVFARAQARKWAHNLVLAVATADADLDRTVDYGAGSYTTSGTSNGMGFGALYEATCDILLDEDGESILQPLFRASFTYASIDGYTETQAEAMGLNVGKQTVSYGTFGLGARYIAAIGENVFNRNATLELRAMILQDAGSRRGEADVALGGATGRTQTVRGAEPGSTGIQAGASLNIPIEESSAIFADFNIDARSKATSVNGSVGYRINF